MARAELAGSDWIDTIERLGGVGLLEQEARSTGALQRVRAVKSGVDLLRLILAYCLGDWGLCLTAMWAQTAGLAKLSNVALLGRLRNAAPRLAPVALRLVAATTATVSGYQALRLARMGADPAGPTP
jgi:hypothetical protein